MTIFAKAAEYINEHGWIQETIQSVNGQVCFRGALMGAEEILTAKQRTELDYSVIEHRRLNVQNAEFFAHNLLGTDVITYNDCIARNADEVVHKLKELDEQYEEKLKKLKAG